MGKTPPSRPLAGALGSNAASDEISPVELSLLDLKRLAALHGVNLTAVKSSLTELLVHRGPSIVHLRDPDHFVFLQGGDAKHCSLIDGGALRILTHDDLQRRFTGHALVPSAAVEGPDLRVANWAYSFRAENVGETVDAEYVVTNAGTGPLEISVDHTSCDCVAASVESQMIAPRGQGVLRASLVVTRGGRISRHILVRTNDPCRRRLLLALQGEGPELCLAIPDSVLISTSPGQGGERRVEIIGAFHDALSVVTSSKELIPSLAGAPPLADGRQRCVLRIALDASALSGSRRHEIGVWRNGARVLEIPVRVLVRPLLTAVPRALFIREAAGAAEVKVMVRSKDHSPFRVTGVESSLPNVHPGWSPSLPKPAHTVTLTLGVGNPDRLDGWVSIITDRPCEAPLVVPIHAVRAPRPQARGGDA